MYCDQKKAAAPVPCLLLLCWRKAFLDLTTSLHTSHLKPGWSRWSPSTCRVMSVLLFEIFPQTEQFQDLSSSFHIIPLIRASSAAASSKTKEYLAATNWPGHGAVFKVEKNLFLAGNLKNGFMERWLVSVQGLLGGGCLSTEVTLVDKKIGEVFRLHVVSHVRPRSVPKVLTKIAEVVASAFRVLLNVLVELLRLRNAWKYWLTNWRGLYRQPPNFPKKTNKNNSTISHLMPNQNVSNLTKWP